MRIGLVIDQFDPHRGGAERWTADFAEQLLGRGHEVHVVACNFAPAAVRLPIVAHALGRVRSRLQFAAEAEKCLRVLDLDVIHDMGSGWYCDLFMSHDGSRLAQWEHKLRVLPAWLRPIKRQLIRWAPRYREFRALLGRQLAEPGPLVLALSRAIAADFQGLHGVGVERIRVVHNGVDTAKFSPDHRAAYRDEFRRKLRVGDQETAFLFVGHDGVRKGLSTAIRALGRLVADGHRARLIVVGGRRLKPYVRLARQCRVADQIHFAGAVENPGPYYAAADAFVLPTFYDPCSLSVLEAMAAGLPSITTVANGAAELMTDEVHGLILSDPADEQQLASLMGRLEDPAQREDMGQAARELALDCTFERNCEKILEIYEEIVAAKSGIRRLPESRRARAA
jgi:UDP-glucose:(heptosyl)LPS alpha-1,3-glucosyltransferase